MLFDYGEGGVIIILSGGSIDKNGRGGWHNDALWWGGGLCYWVGW